MEFFDLVRNMRAMRRLKPDPVPLSLVRKVLDAGVQAPSGMNSQPWSFVVVQDEDGKAFLAKHYRAALESRFGANLSIDENDDSSFGRTVRSVIYQMEHLHETPILLLVCGKRDWPFVVSEKDRVGLAPPNYGAIYPCVQNILLACRAVGLGAALTTMHQLFQPELHERFGIPEEWGVVSMIPIGFPMGNFGPVGRKPAEGVTYFDRFESTSLAASGIDDQR